MVDISERVREIEKMVDDGEYFVINRARQYGKTTTLRSLRQLLRDKYIVLSLSFEGISSSGYRTEGEFVQSFSRLVLDQRDYYGISIPEELCRLLNSFEGADPQKLDMVKMFGAFRRWISNVALPVVLLIDEIDSAANNQIFLDFLGILRDAYIARESDGVPTFQSVILSGVTDIKHLKGRIREEADAKVNSPWNIASDFNIDMSLSEAGIKGMLDEYEADHGTGMDTVAIARQIRGYTNGYPFLVSRICQLLDEKPASWDLCGLKEAWSEEGVETAVKLILLEKNTLFDSLMGKVRDHGRLARQLREILLKGESIEYLPDSNEQEQLMMYGFIVNDNGTVAVANKIFEMRLYKYFIGESRFAGELRGSALDHKPEFIKDGELNVPLIMERFIETQKYIRDMDDKRAEKRFIEEEGREKFITYISPIINGAGTYSIEGQTRNRRRMDLVIHYLGKRYVIEMKIWHGDRYNAKGEEQLLDYLSAYGLDTGYLLSFSFNKNKKPGVEAVHIGDKVVYEGIV